MASDMSRIAGDDMLKWVCNRALSCAIRYQNVPEGIKGTNFHKGLDGKQNVMFYRRDFLPYVKCLFSRPQFAKNMYTRFSLVGTGMGCALLELTTQATVMSLHI